MPSHQLISPLLLLSLACIASASSAATDARSRADDLVTVTVLEAAQTTLPARILTTLASGLQDRYCTLTLSEDLAVESSAYMPKPHQLAWKKMRFVASSQFLIVGHVSSREWPVATIVDDETGTLVFNIPQDVATVSCESGAYTLGEAPLLVQPVPVFADPLLEQSLCTLPAGPFAGTATIADSGDDAFTLLNGLAIEDACQQKQGYTSFQLPMIQPHMRFEK